MITAVKLVITAEKLVTSKRTIVWFLGDSWIQADSWIQEKKKEEESVNFFAGFKNVDYEFTTYIGDKILDATMNELEGLTLKDFLTILKENGLSNTGERYII